MAADSPADQDANRDGMPTPLGRTPDDLPYWVALHRVEGMRSGPLWRLIRAFGDLSRAWGAPRGELQAAGLSDGLAAAVAQARDVSDPTESVQALEAAGGRALTWHDGGYPAQLREIPDPPPLLYVQGGPDVATFERSVAVVGTRRMTGYGRHMTEAIAGGLARAGVCVVSGMAGGVDTAAHRAALESGGPTVAVWGTPLDMVYPKANQSLARRIAGQGAILTEYPLGYGLSGENFPTRNRIISGLARGTVIVEAPLDSGALITARYALEQNRDILAVPGDAVRAGSAGANRLLNRGEARAVTSADDVLEALDLDGAGSQPELPGLATATPEESAMLDRLGHAPAHIDELARAAGLPAHRVSAILAIMEIKGLAGHLGGGRYVASTDALRSSTVGSGAAKAEPKRAR